MADSSQPYPDTTQKPSRAAPIKAEDWDRLKDYICSLYQAHKLTVVRQILSDEFDFNVTPRQLIYKLEIWGVQKYKGIRKNKSRDSLAPGSESANTHLFSPSPSTTLTPMRHRYEDRLLVADFCTAVADDGIAFQKYHQLLQAAMIRPIATNAAYRDYLLIACIRTVQNMEHFQGIMDLIAQYTQQINGFIDPLLLSMLQLYAKERCGAATETYDQHLASLSSALTTHGVLKDLSRLPGLATITAFQFLAYTLRRLDQRSQDISPRLTHQLLQHFLSTRALWSKTTRNEKPGASALHACIDWCRSQLLVRPELPDDIQDIRAELHHARLRGTIQLFCGLWHASVQDRASSSWHARCKAEMGISWSELLLAVTWMIAVNPISDAPNLAPEASGGPQDSFVRMARNAASNATEMTRWAERRLWKYFLQVSVWLHEPVHPGVEDDRFTKVYIAKTRAYLSSVFPAESPLLIQHAMTRP
jgi:hypothetical protein